MGKVNFHRFDKAPFEDRFWAKVQKGAGDDCWLWTATKDRRGYGMFSVGKRAGRASRMMRAHRVSLEMKVGRALAAVEEACHRCNNTTCVNPNHLYIGTHRDNMDDLIRSGAIRGEKSSHAKMTDAQVAEAIAHRAAGMQVKEIAALYGMSEAHMSRVTRGVKK